MTVIPAIEKGNNIFEGKLRDLASPYDFLVSILFFGTSWIPPHSGIRPPQDLMKMMMMMIFLSSLRILLEVTLATSHGLRCVLTPEGSWRHGYRLFSQLLQVSLVC